MCVCVDDSLLRFLSAPDWARVQQTARHPCPGFTVSSPASVDIRLLKELVGETFVSGLQEIEGWLDFAGAAEELDILEQDFNAVTACFESRQIDHQRPSYFLVPSDSFQRPLRLPQNGVLGVNIG